MSNEDVYIKIGADLGPFDSSISEAINLRDKFNSQVKKDYADMQKAGDIVIKQKEKENKLIADTVKNIGKEAIAVKSIEDQMTKLGNKMTDALDIQDDIKAIEGDFQSLLSYFGGTALKILDENDLKSIQNLVNNTESDFEALNVLVDYFQQKLKDVPATEELSQFMAEMEGLRDVYEKLGGASENFENELKDIDATFEQIYGNLQPLTTRLGELEDRMYELALAGKQNEDEYKELEAAAIKYRNTIIKVDEAVDLAASNTAGLDNMLNTVNGLVGAFSAWEGATALLGQEDEDLQKTLVRLNGAIALLNGLQQIQVELSNKSSLASKAYAYAQRQAAIATDSTATAANRLKAALATIGIGALIIAVGYLATNWEKVSKWIGVSSDESERANEVNKKSNEIRGDEIAKMQVLISQIKKENLTRKQQKEAVEDYNKEFGNLFGTVNSYIELEKKLIKNGANYIQYLSLRAEAEAAYQIAIEKTKKLLEERDKIQSGGSTFAKANTSFSNIFTNNLTEIPQGDLDKLINAVTKNGYDSAIKANKKYLSQFDLVYQDEIKDYLKKFDERNEYLNYSNNKSSEFEKLGNEIGVLTNNLDTNTKSFKSNTAEINKSAEYYQKATELVEEFTNKIAEANVNNLENEKEKRKAELDLQFQQEKEGFQKQLDSIKENNAKKVEAQKLFNQLYSEEVGKEGVLYEQLNKEKTKIDEEYDAQRLDLLLKANSLILGIYGENAKVEKEAIKRKYEELRDELSLQIKLTNDLAKKSELQQVYQSTYGAENRELNSYDLKTGLDRVKREEEISKLLIEIASTNAKGIVDIEKLKQAQIIDVQKTSLQQQISLFKKVLEDGQLEQYDELIKKLIELNDVDLADGIINDLDKLIGEENVDKVLELVEALKGLKSEFETFEDSLSADKFDVSNALGSFKGLAEEISEELAKALGLSEGQMKAFGVAIESTLVNTYSAISQGIENEINQHQQKVDALQESINEIESELDRERQLYEDGFANNYEARQQELESLKQQKAEEEAELKKAQEKKKALQKAEILADSALQVYNMVTAASSIWKWATGSAGPLGVPIAIAATAAMFGSFLAAKAQAFQAVNQGGNQFRTGLKKGKISLDGPSHEQGGFGLYNNRTGEQVAEMEGNEDVYVVNQKQKQRYGIVLQALLNDAMGVASIDSTIEFIKHHHHDTEMPKSVIHMHDVAIIKAKEEQGELLNIFKEIKSFKNSFEKEFSGYKNERDETEHHLETDEYHIIKKKGSIKKYKKKKVK